MDKGSLLFIILNVWQQRRICNRKKELPSRPSNTNCSNIFTWFIHLLNWNAICFKVKGTVENTFFSTNTIQVAIFILWDLYFELHWVFVFLIYVICSISWFLQSWIDIVFLSIQEIYSKYFSNLGSRHISYSCMAGEFILLLHFAKHLKCRQINEPSNNRLKINVSYEYKETPNFGCYLQGY